MDVLSYYITFFSEFVKLFNRVLSDDVTREDRLALYQWLECNERDRMNVVSEFNIADHLWLCPVFDGEGPDKDGWYKNYKLVDAVLVIR